MAKQEVTVAMHEIDGGSGIGQTAECLGDTHGQGRVSAGVVVNVVEQVVTDPGFEKIPQNVEGISATSTVLKPVEKTISHRWGGWIQMQVGDHQRGTHGKISLLLAAGERSEEHTSELQSRGHLVCRLLLET